MRLESSPEGETQRKPAPMTLNSASPWSDTFWLCCITHIKKEKKKKTVPHIYPTVWTLLHSGNLYLEPQGCSSPLKLALHFQEKTLENIVRYTDFSVSVFTTEQFLNEKSKTNLPPKTNELWLLPSSGILSGYHTPFSPELLMIWKMLTIQC